MPSDKDSGFAFMRGWTKKPRKSTSIQKTPNPSENTSLDAIVIRNDIEEFRKISVIEPTSLHTIDALIKLGDKIVTESSFQFTEDNADIVDCLGFLRTSRYLYTKNSSDIDKAIELGRQAVKATAPTDPSRWNRLDNLACALSARFDFRHWQAEDIMESIGLTKQALQCPFLNDDTRVQILINLEARLTKHAGIAPESDSFQDAIRVCHEIVDSLESLPSTSAKKGVALLNISILFNERFTRTGFRRDLDEALRLAFLSKSCQGMDKETVASTLHNTGQLLGIRYDLTGDIRDLKECVNHLNGATVMMTQKYQEFLYSKAKRYLLYAGLTQVAADVHLAGFAVKEVVKFMVAGQKKYQFLKDAAALYASLSVKSLCLGDWVSFLDFFIASMDTMPDSEYYERMKDETFREESMRRLRSQLTRFQEVQANGVKAVMKKAFDNLGPDSLNLENFSRIMMEFIYPGKFNLNDIDPVAAVILRSLQEFYKQNISISGLVKTMINMVNECIDIRLETLVSERDRSRAMEDAVYDQAASFGLCMISLRLRIKDLILYFNDNRESSHYGILQTDNSDHLTPEELCKMSDGHAKLFRTTGQGEYLEKAIEYAERAFSRLKTGSGLDDLISSTAHSLVDLFYRKYESTGTSDPLRRCLDYSETVLNIGKTKKIHDHVVHMLEHTELMRRLALHTSLIEDFDRAQEHAIHTLSLTSENQLFTSEGMALYRLSMIHKSKYQRTGNPRDLDQCVEYGEKAMEKGARESMLSDYALIMRQKFKSTNAVQDLNRGLELCREAIEVVNKKEDYYATTLNTLGILLYDEYERTRAPRAIEEAIMSYKEALRSSSLGSIKRSLFVNLGNALVSKHEYSGRDEDLDEAVECGQKAVEGLQEIEVFETVFEAFSEMLEKRYLVKHHREDLMKSIHYAETAVNCLSKDHPNRTLALGQLGRVLTLRLSIEPCESLLQRLIEVFTEGYNCTTSLPFHRIQCAREAAKYLFQKQNYRRAADILEAAVKLMPKLNPEWVSVADQQARLSRLAGLAADTAMVSFKAGDELSKVLELLEQGRGVVLGDLVGKRSEVVPYNDTSDYPVLLQKFNTLRMRADSRHSGKSSSKALQDLEHIIGEIRSLPGYERFLLPPHPKELIAMANDGVIVIILTSQIHDQIIALIIKSSGISSLPLKELTYSDVSKRMGSLLKDILQGSLKSFSNRNKKMHEFLGWLWDAVVEPILRELGFTEELATSPPLPRIRWIGVGPLSQAPFHAAGYHFPGSKQNAMSRVISSYVPTLRTLAFSQEKQARQWFQCRFLIVAMPETPDASPLPHVKQEITEIGNVLYSAGIEVSVLEPQPIQIVQQNYIKDVFGTLCRGLSPRDDMTQNPSKINVLDELPRCDFVHFACHGVSDGDDPSQSHLLLLDGKLTVEDILDTHGTGPALAFLSACSTAQVRHSQSVDESLHIASSFLMAGFKHVIGTLWKTNDNIAREVSHSFYTKLFRKGKRKNSDILALPIAETLHAVLDEIRQREYDLPLLWASFVLHGA